MKIIDKASWQIDGGIRPDLVTAHFKRIFSWLDSKSMLTLDGKEVLQAGIDSSVSLHERLLTPEALSFLSAEYDGYLKRASYGEDKDSSLLESIWREYQKCV